MFESTSGIQASHQRYWLVLICKSIDAENWLSKFSLYLQPKVSTIFQLYCYSTLYCESTAANYYTRI